MDGREVVEGVSGERWKEEGRTICMPRPRPRPPII